MQSSGTGVYYQAIPAVGPDGKNLMTLIPVKKVNGQFVHTQPVPAKPGSQHACPAPVSLSQNGYPTVKPTADGHFIVQTPLVNPVFTSASTGCQKNATLCINAANQVHTPLTPQKTTQHNLQSVVQVNKVATVSESPQITNAVKSPEFTGGHYLQIPPNATVRTLPATALPVSVKNRVCDTANSASSNSVKDLPMVVYVSPVLSVKLNETSPCLTSSADPQPKVGQTPVSSSVDQSATLSPGSKKEGSTPMKWVIQKGAGDKSQYLIPVSSPSMTADIYKAVSQIKSVSHENKDAPSDAACSIQETVTPGKDSALVMCNGKVFFVAKKNAGTKDVTTNAGNEIQHVNAAQPSATVLGSSEINVVQKPETEKSKKDSDIIDLCCEEDDGSQSFQLTLSSESESDSEEESNVIFVSYIPPKSRRAGARAKASQNTRTKDTDNCKVNTGSTDGGSGVTATGNIVTVTNRGGTVTDRGDQVTVIDGGSEVTIIDGGSEVTGRGGEVTGTDRCGEVTGIGGEVTGTGRCGEVTGTDSKVTGTSSTDSESSKSEAAEPALETSKDQTEQPEIVTNDEKEDAKKIIEETASDQDHRPKSDSELRRMFGLVSDLRISLQKINVFKKSLPQEETKIINKRTLEGIRKLIRHSNIETKLKQLIQERVSSPKSEQDGQQDIKRPRLEEDEENNNTNTSSSSSSPPNTELCDVDMQSVTADQSTDSMTLQTHQNSDDAHSAQATCESTKQAPTSPSSSISGSMKAFKTDQGCCETSRGVGTEPSSGHGQKSWDQLVHLSQSSSSNDVAPSTSQPVSNGGSVAEASCSSTTNLTQHTAGQHLSDVQKTTTQEPNNPIKAHRQTENGKYKIPCEFYSSVVLDPEEIKRQERIKRLKDLLKQKEAELEKLRMSF